MENAESKFQDLYKAKSKSDLQERRREELLKEQKLQRSLFQDETRNIQKVVTGAKKAREKPKNNTRSFKSKYQVNYQLQLSEWLKDKPENLEDWFLVPCPKGNRCMVIACGGYTEMYNKYGKLYDTFESLLPGNVGSQSDVTILDCIYVDSRSTFYVLDALAYGNQDLVDCEAQFRLFWLKTKLQESDLSEISERNPYAFVCLEFRDLEDTCSASTAFQQYPLWEDNCPELDGFLFYHKEASYTFGTTPLVGWLFAFMIPEVFGLPVNPAYLEQKPSDYTDYIKYIIEFDEKMAMKKNKIHQKWNKFSKKMEEDFVRDDEAEDDDDARLKSILKANRDLEQECELETIG